ncbi:MAG: thiamine phosphate synthase [Clostridia bacterium]|nr:thiamine phosphate synthase [Clostridia bacterium]
MEIDYSFYLCTESDMCYNHDSMYKKVEEAILGGVSFIQIREKNKSTVEILKIAQNVQRITNKHKIPLVINDRVDIALAINADGVHLGQDDMPCSIARKILGQNKIIGVSVHNLEEAYQAKLDGANYLGVGAMFKSKTKPDAQVVDFKILKEIRDSIDLPIVVIGGINQSTIPLFKNINIDGFAMISPILKSDNVLTEAKNYKNLINQIKNY